MSLLDEVEYESLFAFKYSPRPFTKAARFKQQVDENEKKRRLKALFEKHESIAFALAKKYESQNKLVHFKVKKKETDTVNEKEWVGKTVDVFIKKAFPQTLRGELCF